MTQRIDAIDLSHWQDDVDFNAVASAGVVGCIHKVSEGTGYTDPTYAARKKQALDAGLCWGGYHFLKHGNVSAQMDYFVGKAGLPAGSRLVIDYEDSACVLDDLQEAIEALGTVDPTAQICTYAGGLLKGQVSSSKTYPWLSPTSLWLAQYTTGTPSWPTNIWEYWSLWQYSESGSVPGVGGACDVNQFNGDQDACRRWFGPVGAEPEPPIDAKTVSIDINVSEGVTLMLSVNGELVVL